MINSLVIISFIHFGYSHTTENPFENFRKEINNRYINLSTDQVCQAIKDERPVSEKFEEYLDKDNRVNKIIEIRKQGTTVDSLKATEMVTNVSKDFAKKQSSLLSNIKWATRIQLLCGVTCPACGLSAYWLADKHNAQVPHLVLIGFSIASATLLFISSYKMTPLQTHLDETYKMQAEWQHRFKKEKKSQEAQPE